MEEESEYSESSSSAGFASRCEPSSSSSHLIPSRGPQSVHMAKIGPPSSKKSGKKLT